jgi:hypothetical protein
MPRRGRDRAKKAAGCCWAHQQSHPARAFEGMPYLEQARYDLCPAAVVEVAPVAGVVAGLCVPFAAGWSLLWTT